MTIQFVLPTVYEYHSRLPPSMRSSSFVVVPMGDLEILKWFFVLIFTVILAAADTRVCGHADVKFQVVPATGRIHDSFGRERIFHGLNVVVKGAPWHPLIDEFDAQLSFSDADILLLSMWGMNVVRLGIMWPGVEPSRGFVNSTYLGIMKSIVSKLHSAGIYTLLEFHQDLYSPQFCGEGLPSWTHDQLSQDKDSSTSSSEHQEDPASTDMTTTRLHRQTRTSASAIVELDVQKRSKQAAGTSSKILPNSITSKMTMYTASFPEPLEKRWPWPSAWDTEGWEASPDRCKKLTWWMYYFSYAVSRAFQDLYDNKWGLADLMGRYCIPPKKTNHNTATVMKINVTLDSYPALLFRYWRVVAGAFKDEPGVLGYELMNEPWSGNVFSNPLLFLPGVADSKNLAPLYEKLQAAVRSVDREKILFFETITFDNFRCGWSSVPGGDQWKNTTVLSYHYYTPPNFSPKQAFAERSKESRRLGCGSMLTEFFISSEQQDKRGTEVFRNFRTSFLSSVAGGENVSGNVSSNDNLLSCNANAPKDSAQAPCYLIGFPSREDLTAIDHLPTHRKLRGHQEVRAKEIRSVKSTDALEVMPQKEDASFLMSAKEVNDEAEKLSKEKKLTSFEQKRVARKTKESEDDSVNGVLSAADLYVQSWMGWEYKAFVKKTGSVVQQSMFHGNGEVNKILAKKLARTYPRSVCGNINSFSFNPLSSAFSFSYNAGAACFSREKEATTEIFFHRQFYYPNGLSVGVNPICASASETGSFILVKHTVECVGLVIDVRISRL